MKKYGGDGHLCFKSSSEMMHRRRIKGNNGTKPAEMIWIDEEEKYE